MATQLFDALIEPVSAESACGPDLDLEGDFEFMNFLARAEGMLPGRFFSSGPDGTQEKPFERGSLDFQPEIAAAEKFLERTRDLRILILLAKFAILDRKLLEFVDLVDTISLLLAARWDEINPRDEHGDFTFRLGIVQALDDFNLISQPLQFTPLIRHPRAGPFTFRNKLVADGTLAREGEEVFDAATIDRAFMDIALDELVEQRDRLARLVHATESIRATTIDHVGHEKSIRLNLLEGSSKQILVFLDDFVKRRDPAAALETGEEIEHDPSKSADVASEGSKSGPACVIESLADVAAALAGVASYFLRSEPSSPALLLVKQAEQLVGKNFIDVMRLLMPEHIDQAAIGVGKHETFDMPIQRLSDQMDATNAGVSIDMKEPVNIRDRTVAIATLQQIETYYTRNEPTSPIPFLCERARKLSTRDFIAILKEILPEHALKAPYTNA
jgi:type VI secretion system protein ImpA